MSHQAVEPTRPSRATRGITAATVLAAVGLVWWVAGRLAGLPPLPGRLQSDPLTGYVSALADLVARLASLATLGGLMAIVAFSPRTEDHGLPPRTERLARWSARAGQVWFWSAALLTLANSAYVNGVPMGYTLRPDAWWDFQSSTPSGLAWGFSALVALGITLVCYASRHVAAHALAYAFGLAALMFVAVTGNVTVGLNHDWATDAAIAVTLGIVPLGTAAVAVTLLGGDEASIAGVRRYQFLAPWFLAAAVGGHAVIAWQELAGVSPLATLYGLPTIGLFACLAALLLSWGWRRASGELDPARSSGRRASASVLRDVVIVIAYQAFRAVANHVPPPRFLVPQSIQVNYLGYEVNVPATVATVAGLGRPNLLWVGLAVGSVAAYLWAVGLVRRNGGRWPLHRTALWILGWVLTLYLATSGLWEYSTAVYSWHMLVHMTVNMLVPVLCLLGGPFTLLRAASRQRLVGELPGVADTARAIGAYRPFQRLNSPPLLWLNYVGSLFLVYYTPLFPWLMRYHWAHQLMLVYFMVTGYVFFNLLIGVDRQHYNLPHLIRLALIISIMPFHAIFAVGILSSRSLIGAEFYQAIDVRWVGDLMADQNVAGQITWFMGEVPLFIVIIALAAQWFRQDKTDADRIDHDTDDGVDDSFAAYNEMLAELAERDRQAELDRVARQNRLRP